MRGDSLQSEFVALCTATALSADFQGHHAAAVAENLNYVATVGELQGEAVHFVRPLPESLGATVVLDDPLERVARQRPGRWSPAESGCRWCPWRPCPGPTSLRCRRRCTCRCHRDRRPTQQAFQWPSLWGEWRPYECVISRASARVTGASVSGAQQYRAWHDRHARPEQRLRFDCDRRSTQRPTCARCCSGGFAIRPKRSSQSETRTQPI